ncbi:MAG: hypothetical protein WCB11_00835 [Terriglobales bacterium]
MSERFMVTRYAQSPYHSRAILSRRIWKRRRPLPGARRTIKFPLTEIPINCPHCAARLILATVMDAIKFSQRTCPKCGKQFIIEDNVPRKPDDSPKKPNASVKPAKNARKSGKIGMKQQGYE